MGMETSIDFMNGNSFDFISISFANRTDLFASNGLQENFATIPIGTETDTSLDHDMLIQITLHTVIRPVMPSVCSAIRHRSTSLI
jgi:hypothetical protein